METARILEQYMCRDISNLIIQTAFGNYNSKSVFRYGFYEKCEEVLNEINELELSEKNKTKLFSSLLFTLCEEGYINIINLMSGKLNKKNYEKGLCGACKGGNMNIVKLMIENRYPDIFIRTEGLYYACLGGNIDVVYFIIDDPEFISYKDLGIPDVMRKIYEDALCGACEGNNMDIFNVILTRYSNQNYNWQRIYQKACLGGNVDLVKVGREFTNILGLCSACRGGHMNIVKMIIENIEIFSPDNWNDALYGACLGGNMDIVNLMIEKGADDWDGGLNGACIGGHRHVFKFIIDKFKTDIGRSSGIKWGNILNKCSGDKCKFIEDKFELAFGRENNKRMGGFFGVSKEGYSRILQFIVSQYLPEFSGHIDWEDELGKACKKGNVDIIKFVIKKLKL